MADFIAPANVALDANSRAINSVMRYSSLGDGEADGANLEDAARIAELERELGALAERVARLEREGARASAPPARRPAAASQPPPPATVRAPAPPRERQPPDSTASERELAGWSAPTLEELLGGRVLALAGGAAVLLGVAFFVALAVDRGWLGEVARITLAFIGSAVLLAVGVWLHERRGRTQASLAAVGTAVAALFLTLTAATTLYDLLPQPVALLAALAIGATATLIAVRWDSRTVAGLGIVGALLSPVLIDATADGSTIAFLAVALTSAAGVLLWRRWDWLGLAAFVVTAPQLALWTFDRPGDAVLVVVLSGYAGLILAIAVGYELRVPSAGLRESSALLISFDALIVAALGAFVLIDRHDQTAGGAWIGALALAHGALGAAAMRSRRVNDDIGLVVLGTALVLADVSFGFLAEGAVLGVGWAASAAAVAALGRSYARRPDVVQLTVGSQLSLAAGHALLFDAPPSALTGGAVDTIDAIAVLAAITVAALGAARLSLAERSGWREPLDGLALLTVAYATAVTLDGAALVVAWTAVATALVEVARTARDAFAAVGALCFLAGAGAHTLTVEAPPDALVYGAESLASAAVALGAFAIAAARATRIPPEILTVRRIDLALAAGVAAMYLASVAIVSAFQPGPGAFDSGLDLDVRQQGQVLLSAFWSVCGLGSLWLGLRRNRRELRLAGFALLLLAVAKVFLFDLSALGSVYRVASFVALGVLLLTAAFAYQRMRVPQDNEAGR